MFTRYRCTACGNLTRFDVTATRRTRQFHHYTVGGELTIEGTEVLEELVEEVSCRWCASPRGVEPIADVAPADEPLADEPPAGSGAEQEQAG